MTKPQKLLTHLALAGPAMLPLVWMLSTSLKSDSQVYGGKTGFSLSSLIPSPAVWSN